MRSWAAKRHTSLRELFVVSFSRKCKSQEKVWAVEVAAHLPFPSVY